MHTIYDAFVAALTDEQLSAVEGAMLQYSGAPGTRRQDDEGAVEEADAHIA